MSFRLKLLSVVTALTLATSWATAQVPQITLVDKTSAGVGTTITISGNNFGTNAANIVVYAGSIKADIQTITDNTIEATVPASSVFDNITVTNVTTGKSAWSPSQFMVSYGGTSPVDGSKFIAVPDVDSETGLFDLCMCDFDGDKLNDVATASTGNTSTGTPPAFAVSLFRNTSTVNTISWAAKVSLIAGVKALHVRCGDLDGDGKKDLVVTESDPGNRIFILKNNSTVGNLSFVVQNTPFPGKSPKRVEINDLDGDGKPELIVSDQKSGNNSAFILPNTSSVGTISFGTLVTVNLPIAFSGSTDGLQVQDIDGDRLPEIIASQFLTANSNVFVFKNGSTVGNFKFDRVATLTLSGTPVNLRVGDIDGDKNADIVATQLLAGSVSVFVNQSTSTEIKFAAAVAVSTDLVPWGLDIGDLDGDGKADVVVASLTGTGAIDPKSLTILGNTSTPGVVTFTPKIIKATTFVNRHVVIGDVNGDGRPEIVYTSIDDNSRNIPASKLSVFKNTSCITPVLTPAGPLVVCSTFPQKLQASISSAATYVWKKDGVVIAGATNDNYTPTFVGQALYTVEATVDGCTKASNAVDLTIIAVGSAPAPTFTYQSPLCIGSTLTITANSAGADGYEWTGPGGYTATGATATRTPYAAGFAGRYEVSVKVGTCVAQKGSVLIETISLPKFSAGFTGADIICAGDSKTLSVSPNDPNFTYQWFDAGGAIAGASSATYAATATGSYSVKATSILYPGCNPVPSDPVSLVKVNLPVVAFNVPAESCKDTQLTFSNQSTLDANAGGNFAWDFGDAGTSTDTSPLHAYATVNTFNAKLTATYRGASCPVSLTKSIKINDKPLATITATGNNFSYCEGKKITLGVTPTFTSYLWSNTTTTATAEYGDGGNVSVQVTNSLGCVVTATTTINKLSAPLITVTATPPAINLGETSQLSATTGLNNYVWLPADNLNNATIANPIATPKETTEYQVTATGLNGCDGSAKVTVLVNVDDPINLLKPSNFFSPNGSDNVNPVWEVGNILSFPQCSVTIFDEKGSKVFEATPYLNNWDGTQGGKQLPTGVYYYVIRCDGGAKPKTGSITLVR